MRDMPFTWLLPQKRRAVLISRSISRPPLRAAFSVQQPCEQQRWAVGRGRPAQWVGSRADGCWEGPQGACVRLVDERWMHVEQAGRQARGSHPCRLPLTSQSSSSQVSTTCRQAPESAMDEPLWEAGSQ